MTFENDGRTRAILKITDRCARLSIRRFAAMNLRILLVIVVLSIHDFAYANDAKDSTVARFGRVLIEIPVEFESPHRLRPNKQTELNVYVSKKDLPPTLLQLTRIVVPEVRSDLSEKNRYGAASNFLTGFLQEFSKNVADWSRSSTETVQLGGHVAVRAKWTGIFHGIPNTGTMYFIVFGTDSFCFHAFGRTDVPNSTLESAIRVIEELRVENIDKSLERTDGL